MKVTFGAWAMLKSMGEIFQRSYLYQISVRKGFIIGCGKLDCFKLFPLNGLCDPRDQDEQTYGDLYKVGLIV